MKKKNCSEIREKVASYSAVPITASGNINWPQLSVNYEEEYLTPGNNMEYDFTYTNDVLCPGYNHGENGLWQGMVRLLVHLVKGRRVRIRRSGNPTAVVKKQHKHGVTWTPMCGSDANLPHMFDCVMFFQQKKLRE